MLIEKIKGLTDENKEFLFNDKYSIFDIKPSGDLLFIHFLKIEEIPDEELDDEELEETRVLFGYSFSISKKEQKDYPDINYYVAKFETAKRRNITGSQSNVSYRKLTLQEVQQTKTIIATLENGYKDIAFLIYMKELKKHTLIARDKGNSSNAKLEPLYIPLFKDSIEPSLRSIAIEKTMFLGSSSLHRKYTGKVVSALNIRQNPFGTKYTAFVIQSAIQLAKNKTAVKKHTVNKLSSFFTGNENLSVKKKEKDVHRKALSILNNNNNNDE